MPWLFGAARAGRAVHDVGLRRAPLRLDRGPLLELKDPCPVHDGERWHLFATAVTARDGFQVLHATAYALGGPWRVQAPVGVGGLSGSCIAAPGAVADAGVLHLFLQTDYNVVGGLVEHLVSTDGGERFSRAGTALQSLPGTPEAGIYDPHPSIVGGRRYLAYSAFSVVGSPDLHLARSTTDSWHGPWERLGPVLAHEQVWCHNQRGARAYEWGLEAAQLLELPGGRVLLNAVCFLPGGRAGTRQRVFFALAEGVTGPYEVLGPVLEPPARGEVGHACAVLDGDGLALLFQEHSLHDPAWRLGLARAPLDGLDRPARSPYGAG